MPRKKRVKFNPFSSESFLMLIILQMIFILYLVGQFLIFAPWDNELEPIPSDAAVKLAEYDYRVTRIGTGTYKLFMADDSAKRMQGLSDIESMNGVEGMAFVFNAPTPQSFWMKDMHMSLDFIYVENGVVVEIVENISPETYPDVVAPGTIADTVIELRDDQIELNGLKIGDSIDL